MKKIAFCHNLHPQVEGLGDEIALKMIARGIEECNVKCTISDAIEDWIDADFVFLSNTAYRLEPYLHALRWHQKRVGLIAFHQKKEQLELSELFLDSICAHLGKKCRDPIQIPQTNSHLFDSVELCIANSTTEAQTILRDCPTASVKTIPWTTGLIEKDYLYNDRFLSLVGLQKGEYILQIGRLSPRKNQMGSILATRHLDIPLVLISSHIFAQHQKWIPYWIEAILKWRRAPTFLITNDLTPCKMGLLEIMNPPPFSTEMIVSAYQNAGLFLHPAFAELPGFVYLEAAKLGVPTIASTWTTISDYFQTPGLDGRISYAEPYQIDQIEDLIRKNFGKSFEKSSHPSFLRSCKEVGKEFLHHLSH